MSEAANKKPKDVIYVDADDEITAIIEKVRDSSHKIVALVLPKRAAVLQSVVNMKLLKRTADSAKKNLVIITSEAGLLPLAGSVGIHVAKSLQSKPEVPDAPAAADDKPEVVSDTGDAVDAALDKTRTVGELAGAAVLDNELDDTIELDDEEEAALENAVSDDAPAKAKKKKFKIPNFNKFRVMLALAILGVILLISGVYAAIAVMPKATVSIKTDSEAVNSGATLILKTGDNVVVDMNTGVVPAQIQEAKKTLTQQVDATGQQNNGEKAAGSVTIRNCTDSSISIPAGSGVNSGGLTFITQTSMSLAAGNFTSGGICKSSGTHVDNVDVVSQQGGTKYNIGAGATFAVAGYSSSVSGTGSAMSGGTDDIKKVVSQADIDSASDKIKAQDTTEVKDQLKKDLRNNGFFPIEATFNAGEPQTKTSAKVGDEAANVTVTQTITYTMLAANEDDLKKLIKKDVEEKIDLKKQKILDYGLSEATFSEQERKPDGAAAIMQTKVIAGPELDINAIKKQVAGMKAGAAEQLIKNFPGVTDVTVRYSPFWVSSIPKKLSKITVTIEKPEVTTPSNDSTSSP